MCFPFVTWFSPGRSSDGEKAMAVVLRASSLVLTAGESHSTSAHTSSEHPPQPVVARVAAATSGTLVAPSCTQATMAALLTPLHRQIVASSGIASGEVGALAGCGIRAGSSRYAGSAGTGVRRVYVVTSSAATAPAPT